MANYYRDNEDIRFYMDRGIDWGPLVELTEYGFADPEGFDNTEEAVEFYQDILEMVGDFVAEQIAPSAAAVDRAGVTLEDGVVTVAPETEEIFEQIKDLDLHGMCVPRDLDGMNCPMLVYIMTAELFSRADVALVGHHGFHGGIAMTLLLYSIMEGSTEVDVEGKKIVSTRFSDAIAEIIAGEAWGCMDITEPDAGSDMGALRTVGEQDEQGNWFISGEKTFITSGHGKYHLLIARTEKNKDPDNPMAGLAGLSMFLAPAYEEDDDGNIRRLANVERVEEKLGLHGSVTASISFDRTPAHLIGKRGEGFKYMLTLMNNARVIVGFECIGLMEAAYRKARDYAEERPSMGKPIARHEMIADYLDELRTDIQALRALGMHCAFQEEMAQKALLQDLFLPAADDLEARRRGKQLKRYKHESRRTTPLLKYLAAEKAVEAAHRCIQIHGGNGYITEFGAEKFLRDAVVMPIYEGTSQIQALMAMKDTLGAIIKNPQGFFTRVARTRWRARWARDPLERRVAGIQQLSLSVQQHLISRTVADKVRSLQGRPLSTWPEGFLKDWNPKRDFAFAMLHAERLTRLLADEAIVEVLLKQATAHPERKELLERYLERAEPRCRYLHEQITTTGERLLADLARAEGSDDADEQSA